MAFFAQALKLSPLLHSKPTANPLPPTDPADISSDTVDLLATPTSCLSDAGALITNPGQSLFLKLIRLLFVTRFLSHNDTPVNDENCLLLMYLAHSTRTTNQAFSNGVTDPAIY